MSIIRWAFGLLTRFFTFWKSEWEDSRGMTIALGALIACLIVLVGVLVSLLFPLADRAFCPRHDGIGIVQSTQFVPAHTSVMFTLVGRVPVSMPLRIADSYSARVTIESVGVSNGAISYKTYSDLQAGNQVNVVYTVGWSGSVYINQISLR